MTITGKPGQTSAAAAGARRGTAVLLLALLLLPWYGLVALRATGPAVDQTIRLGELYYRDLWLSSALSLAAIFFFSWIFRPDFLHGLGRRTERALLRPSALQLGALLGVLATAISLWTSAAVLQRKPALLDGVAQLLQARYFAAGVPAGPPLENAEFWHFQFMALSERGWLSQYPPGFSALLALAGPLAGAWLVGPVLLGLAVFLVTLIAERIFPDDTMVARIGAVLAALSPMLSFHAAGYMSHVLALALTAVAVLASLKAMEGSWTWALLSGAAAGAMFTARPYSALVLGAFATVFVWLTHTRARAFTRAQWSARLAAAFAGALPFVSGVLIYNRHFFGSPLRFGYQAAEGPGHGLGFHVDPWGNPYGPAEALGYTSADLQALSVEMLQTPLPILLLVALCLLCSRRLSAGATLVAVWALLPVAAHALYWHHDLFMGPRLLYEALPGWCLLVAYAALWSVRAIPEAGWRLGEVRLVSRSGTAAVFALALIAAALYAGPQKLVSYRSEGARSGMTISPPPVERATLVFVHGSWEDRVAARLAAAGMRVDSVRLALAHNSTCGLELYLEGWERGARETVSEELPVLRFQRGSSPRPRALTMPSGSVIRAFEGETLDPLCERQASSDFEGVLGTPPLLWQGDLPGLGSAGAMFVRDFGPERNGRLLARFPDRAPMVLLRRSGEIRLAPYDSGMAELWPEPPM